MKKLNLYFIILASLSALNTQSCFTSCAECLEYIAACACCDHEYITSSLRGQKQAQANLNAIIQNGQNAEQIRAYTVQRYNLTPEETPRSPNGRDNGSSHDFNASDDAWAGSELDSLDLLNLSHNSLDSAQRSSNNSENNCPNNSLSSFFAGLNPFYVQAERDGNNNKPSIIAPPNTPRSEPNSWENSPTSSRSNSSNNSPRDLDHTMPFYEKRKRATTESQDSNSSSSTRSTLPEPDCLAVYTMPHYNPEEMD